MKVFQLAALFGGAVSAVQPLIGRDDGTTTAVVYVTSTYTITKCAASVTNCPVASATEVFTSTTVMSVTTTICPVTSTPGLQSPESGSVPSSSAFPINPPGTANTLSDSVPTSYAPGVSGPSSAYVPPVQSSALPTGPSLSIDFSVSLISPNPSLPVTGTDSIPTSSAPGASGLSSVYTPPVQTSALLIGPTGSDTVIVPRPTSSGSASLPGSLTDSVPTSVLPGVSASGSSIGYVPSQPITTADPGSSLPTPGTNTGAVPNSGVTPSSGYGQSSMLSNTAPDAVLTSEYPGPPGSSVGPSSGVYSPSVSSNTDAIPTSGYLGSSVTPSGSNSASGSSNTATGGVPTSSYPGSSALPSSGASSPSSRGSTATDAVTTSAYAGSSALPSSSASSPSTPSDTATVAIPTSGYPISSGYGNASSTGPVGTNTDSVPTSSTPNVSGPSSSEYTAPGTTALPTQGNPSGPGGYPSGSGPSMPSSTLSTVSGTYPATTSPSSGLVYPGLPPPASTTVIDGTTRITSHLTLASTNYVTAPLPSSSPSTDTATDAIPTSRDTGYLPSGSGYPYPSGSANGTIIAPTPSYIEVPINMGQIVAAGQNPIAAIVIALAFALFA